MDREGTWAWLGGLCQVKEGRLSPFPAEKWHEQSYGEHTMGTTVLLAGRSLGVLEGNEARDTS